eukprot:543191_1
MILDHIFGNELEYYTQIRKTSKVDASKFVSKTKKAITGGMRRSTSRKKIAMTVNTDEPFNGDIVMAMSELLPPLEKCAREIDDLLKDSLSRFKKTHTCCKLYTEYCDKKKMETLQRTMSM